MIKTILIPLVTLVLTASAIAQHVKQSESVQYLPVLEKRSLDRLVGTEIGESGNLNLSFDSVPSRGSCGSRCMSKAYLVLELGLGGIANRYSFGRGEYNVEVSIAIEGIESGLTEWDITPTEPLQISGTSSMLNATASFIFDVTEYAPDACEIGDDTTMNIRVTVTSIDSSGLSGAMMDSLVLTAQLIQEYRILPYEGITLNCSTDQYVKSLFADTVHPASLSWDLLDGSTPCPDLYPSFEVEVLRLYNTSPSNRDSELKTYAKVDWRQAQRFITYGPATHIDFTLAEGTGYYAWRVRPIGNYYPGGIGNEKNWGCWSKAPAQDDMVTILSLSDMDNQQNGDFDSCKPYFYYRQFDRDKNWIFNRSFVEDDGGLTGIAEGITYASRLMQPLQVQTPVTTSGDVLVQQSVLDYEGRPLISTLAAPKVRSV